MTAQVEDPSGRREASSGGAGSANTTQDRELPVLDLLLGAGDGAVAMDADGRIVGWNAAAEHLFGFRRDDVLGHPCHEVLGCHDLQGNPLSPSKCLLLQSGRAGSPPVAGDVFMRHRTGRSVAVSTSALLLPEDAGGRMLVLLRLSASGVVDLPARLAPAAGPGPAVVERRPGTPLDLAGILDRLLIATGADAAELFLTVPMGNQLVLAAHRGGAPRAFREITRFEQGQGFPGLVARTGTPILSLDLPRDDRYLRSRVKRQDFRYYLCVPVWSDAGFLGSLHIASRRHAETVVSQLPFLAQVARELGWALELARLRTAEPVRLPLDPSVDASVNLRTAANQALQALVEAAGADSGVLLLLESTSRTLEPASEWHVPARLCRTLARVCDPAICPAIVHRRCLICSSVTEVESTICQAILRDLATFLCLPLVGGGKPIGVALVGYHRREPLPTSRLSFLHTAVTAAAVALHNAQVALREEAEARRRAVAHLATEVEERPEQAHPGAAADGEASARSLANPPFLDLRCLGRFTLLRNGRTVGPEQFARRRSLTLLKVLLTRYGKEVHREELMELLWPEGDPQSTSGLLNVVVHYLRSGLEPQAPPGHLSSFIRTNGDCYFFNIQSPHRLDSKEFLEAADLAGRLEAGGSATEAIAVYQRALALYAGDFLEDEPYSDWCALERQCLRERFLTVLRRAARLHLDQGNVDTAVACYRRALQMDGTLEEVQRALMEALWRAGRRDESLRQYQECRTILERELGITPMPETEALRQQISNSSISCQ